MDGHDNEQLNMQDYIINQQKQLENQRIQLIEENEKLRLKILENTAQIHGIIGAQQVLTQIFDKFVNETQHFEQKI